MGIESLFNGTGQIEPWVAAAVIATHLGCSDRRVRRMAAAGELPGAQLLDGNRSYWRFKISAIDAALARQVSRRTCRQ
jgi:excisionase family DNA binding protein